MFEKNKSIRPLPFCTYYFGVVALNCIGLLISIYLSVSHYLVHSDIGYHSFCALTKSINCDTVSQSPYSIFWNLPVAVWGVVSYSFFLILTLFSAFPSGRRLRVWGLSFIVALLFSNASLVFAAVSAFYIGSYCILCIATYAVNLLLVYLTWIIRRRFNADKLFRDLNADLRFLWEKRRATLPAFGLFGVGFLLTLAFFPKYWQLPMPSAPMQAQSGLTEDGHPWIGAEQPMLEIVEFADYQCFQCKKMHQYLRGLVARHPDKIRLVHRSFPMDHEVNFIVNDPFHVGSGKLSLLSIYAAVTGKFWEMNDVLYGVSNAQGAINLREIAAATGIETRALAAALKDPGIKKRLEFDILQGLKLGILGTPSYVINGQVYQGFVPPEFILAVKNAESS
jgi:protein-disulfide isomerase/uncharacterized membrane protein